MADPHLCLFVYSVLEREVRVCEALASGDLRGEEETEGMAGRIIPALGVFWERLDASPKCWSVLSPFPCCLQPPRKRRQNLQEQVSLEQREKSH